MKNKMLIAFNQLTLFSLTMSTAFPNSPSSRVQSFLYKFFSLVFFMYFSPMVPAVFLKIVQFIYERNWEMLLDTAHMFLIGLYTICLVFFIRFHASYYKKAVDEIGTKLLSADDITVEDLFSVITLWAVLLVAFTLFFGSAIYYGENLVPVWIPFIDNREELPAVVFYFVWCWQSCAAIYIWFALAVWGPFILVSSACIRKEVKYLKEYGCNYFSSENIFERKKGNSINYHSHTESKLSKICSEESNTIQYVISRFVEHDIVIQR